MASIKPIQCAILDDYQAAGRAHFAHLEPRIEITTFSETLDPRDPAQLEALIQRLQLFDAIVTMRERTPFPAELVRALPNLKVLLTTGPRNQALDLDAFAARNIPVAGTVRGPKGLPAPVQHTWALILALARHLARDDGLVKRGDWQGPSLAVSLPGKTLGLLGLGNLGSKVGKIAAEAFGMDVVAWSANLTQKKADDQAQALGLPARSFRVVSSKEELFQSADVVSVHYILSERSRGIVGREELGAMKPSALLVNTSRGAVVDEHALLETAMAGRIGGVALDVFGTEPLPVNSAWRTMQWGREGRSEVLLSPHMGYCDEELINGWYQEAAENMFCAPQTRVTISVQVRQCSVVPSRFWNRKIESFVSRSMPS